MTPETAKAAPKVLLHDHLDGGLRPQTIIELAQFNLDFLESCTPGYYNNEGKPSERGIRNGFYGAGSFGRLWSAPR